MPNPSDTESARLRAPGLSLLLAYAAVLPIPFGSLLAWVLPPVAAGSAARATVIWAGAILCFLAGVRRGLSFRQPGGAYWTQVAGSLWLFLLGVGALEAVRSVGAVVLLLAGYASIGLGDVWAARLGYAPRYFARLRPLQMLVPVAALLALLVLRLR